MASAGDITEPGAYHLVHECAMAFFRGEANGQPEGRRYISLLLTARQQLTLRSLGHPHPAHYFRDKSDVLRMTGFGNVARGHAKHLLKNARSKVTQGRRKSKCYLMAFADLKPTPLKRRPFEAQDKQDRRTP